jgi:hypothetical protein
MILAMQVLEIRTRSRTWCPDTSPSMPRSDLSGHLGGHDVRIGSPNQPTLLLLWTSQQSAAGLNTLAGAACVV